MYRIVKIAGVATCIAASVCSSAAFAECNPAITSTTPSSRFSVTGSDSAQIRDSLTQLIWMRCSLGQVWSIESENCEQDAAMPSRYAYAEALAAASTGESQWRVPNKKELASIIDFSCVAPASNSEIFPGTEAAVYWSSTPRVYSSTFMAFAIDFDTGAFVDAGIDQQHAVRLVRDAPGR